VKRARLRRWIDNDATVFRDMIATKATVRCTLAFLYARYANKFDRLSNANNCAAERTMPCKERLVLRLRLALQMLIDSRCMLATCECWLEGFVAQIKDTTIPRSIDGKGIKEKSKS